MPRPHALARRESSSWTISRLTRGRGSSKAAELRYLPAYSPDMNPIEKAFSKLKAFLRKIAERAVAGLMRALETCAEIFKPSQCTNYFKSCGYEHDTG